MDVEDVMRLSDKELKLITEVEKRRSDRKKGAWLNFVVVIILSIATFAGFQVIQEQWILLGLLTAFAAAYLANVYFAVRPENELIELLQRYVNQDAEAVEQIAESAAAKERSTDSGAASTI